MKTPPKGPLSKEAWLDRIGERWSETAMGALKIKITDVREDQIEMTMPISDAVRQPFGALHGGASMLLAETAASTHANFLIDMDVVVPVGIEINGSHLRPASEGTVMAVARVVRVSKSFITHQVEMSHLESGKMLSVARVTNYLKPLKD